jgi:hypothetical protein
MSPKATVTITVFIGSIIGGYIPVLLGMSFLSMWGLVTSAIGGIIGIWIGMKISA